MHSSVELRMRSDHDFSTFLSGGLDSSLIAAIASRNKERLDTFSIGLSGDGRFDESAYSQVVVDALATHHHPHQLGAGEFREQHRELVASRREPVGVPNEVALKILSCEISRTHRVVLSGEGADEVFAGYGRIFLLPHDWGLMQRPGDKDVAKKLEARYGRELPLSFMDLFIQRYGYTTHEYAVDTLRQRSFEFDGDDLRESIESDIAALYESIEADTPFNLMLVLFQNLHLPGLLYRLDKATMAHSVEARVPFLDHRLVEFVNTLPIEFKVRPVTPLSELETLVADEISEVHDVPKAILKDVSRQMLPAQIVDRRKMGFPIPPSFYGVDGASAAADYGAWINRNLDLLSDGMGAGLTGVNPSTPGARELSMRRTGN